ncbi:uncharacterized protein LOC124462108 [Drosophila willistoni]|uniref:uncharacterized protein LOC124462108 n=1 Tax=Drosophila willistoni TaxID=7260 RepID=UPI001F078ED8|nr:uncharacterized protein LOC111519151 isoform X1 [Drosophila willistoni]XP_046869472.1 uncharacterized protein LOC124462108 [Drosophila willistoni]
MLVKILIFCISYGIIICETNGEPEPYIDNIRDDYCMDYCDKECNPTENEVTCTKIGNTIITDKYKIQLSDKSITLTWKLTPVNLTYIKPLNLSHNKYKASILLILSKREVIYPRSTDYMRALNINKVDHYGEKTSTTSIHEYDIDIINGPSNAIIMGQEEGRHLEFRNTYISLHMPNLKGMFFLGPGAFRFHDNTFENNTQLESISFSGLTLENLNAITFENLTKIRDMQFWAITWDNQEFLSSMALQNNLEFIMFSVHDKISLKYFENYRKLKKILIDPETILYYFKHMIRTNITAYLCEYKAETLETLYCHFNIGINGKRCPEKCDCKVDNDAQTVTINCSEQGLFDVPELPVPISGKTNLYFQGNALRKLPNKYFEGYDNIRRLHVSYNDLTDLTIEQLPKNLSLLDIQNTNITSVDPNLIEYLESRNTTFLQSGVNWIINCKNEKLLNYLSNLSKTDGICNHAEYYHLKGPCPKTCNCCIDDTTESQFVINCTSRTINTFPYLPNNIIGNSSLLLDNNNVETLPKLRNSTLARLSLKNNNLSSLHIDQLPSNITMLDIRHNNLTNLDDHVTQFISNLPELHLSGNPWQCSCRYTMFLNYLRKEKPEEYKTALRHCSGQEYCPDLCTCCKDEESQNLIINCTDRGLSEIPSIPTSDNVVLLFEKNVITHLKDPINVKGFDQLKELHLKGNSTQEFDSVLPNIELLDIRDNDLTKVTENISQSLISLSKKSNLSLFLSGNPWTCDCSFIRLTKALAGNIKDLHLTKCNGHNLLDQMGENYQHSDCNETNLD